MQERSILERLTILEQNVEGLEALPERVAAVELQIVQLRTEMNAGFSALGGELRGELRAVDESLRDAIRAVDESLRAEIRTLHSSDEETRRFMRILHEDVIARIAAIRLG
jgi:hypothetical protein